MIRTRPNPPLRLSAPPQRSCRILTSKSAIFAILLLPALGVGDAHTQRLSKPWSQISNLTDDQKSKLIQIHHAARAQIQKILERELRDSLTILTQPQLDQLRDIEDQKTLARKLAATQPTSPAP